MRKSTTLRIPKEILDTLDENAKSLGISRNAYIIMILNRNNNIKKVG